MDRSDFIDLVWKEKRGRVITDTIYPLGLLIALDNRPLDLGKFAQGLLHFLLSDPEKALSWAEHWGRTIIQVHPDYEFGFNYTFRKNAVEKKGVIVASSRYYDFRELTNTPCINPEFSIFLNDTKLLYEGWLLAIERMLDEFVWWRYQILLEEVGPLRSSFLYADAIRECLNGGVNIGVKNEVEIIRAKIKDPCLPVRIYGSMYKDVKLPIIIGYVERCLKEDCFVNRTTISRDNRYHITSRNGISAPDALMLIVLPLDPKT